MFISLSYYENPVLGKKENWQHLRRQKPQHEPTKWCHSPTEMHLPYAANRRRRQRLPNNLLNGGWGFGAGFGFNFDILHMNICPAGGRVFRQLSNFLVLLRNFIKICALHFGIIIDRTINLNLLRIAKASVSQNRLPSKLVLLVVFRFCG